mmetsp:Transcript_39782/g.158249  ORF Transcript_39782/g.158249 Transcript_39782/m.158249 type:complete len:81 (-) Transcript_39782:58-300(-)
MRLCVAAGELNRTMFEPVRVERPEPDGSGLLTARAMQKLFERHGSRIVLPSWSEISNLKVCIDAHISFTAFTYEEVPRIR